MGNMGKCAECVPLPYLYAPTAEYDTIWQKRNVESVDISSHSVHGGIDVRSPSLFL